MDVAGDDRIICFFSPSDLPASLLSWNLLAWPPATPCKKAAQERSGRLEPAPAYSRSGLHKLKRNEEQIWLKHIDKSCGVLDCTFSSSDLNFQENCQWNDDCDPGADHQRDSNDDSFIKFCIAQK